MTREDCNNAIKVLKNYDLNNSKVNSLLFSAEEITNAFDIAIKALEQQSEDTISRKETVQFLENHSNSFEDVKIRMAFRVASSLVNNPYNLPCVQPKP